MGKGVGLVARLTLLQVQEQADASSGTPPDYEGSIELDPTLLDMARLEAALETGRFELSNTWVHQNLVLHHLGRSMRCSTVLLRKLCHMAGSPFYLADLQEISWRDLQWVELEHQVGRVPVREEVVEDDTGVITLVVIPTPVPVAEEGMEESSDEGSKESMSQLNT